MKTNKLGIDMIKRFEGLRLEAYKDVGGVLTIGYGHTDLSIKETDKITQARADIFLQKDINNAERIVSKYIKSDINENQFSALVCFVFNIGEGNFRDSTMCKRINASDPKASEEFLRWVKVKGQQVQGLVYRRIAEKALYDLSV